MSAVAEYCGVGVKQDDGRWPRRLEALLEVRTTIGRLRRLPPGATSASPFGGVFEEGARLVERATASDPHGQALQFERQGYFSHDDDIRSERLVFNRTALLRDSPGRPPTAHPDLLRK
ncbi:hypothetical protein [Bradyrhizobium cenepequi]|uniref:hypothetical protein n=1 Tax=Bradyrhizobium cenepequi TaxID=2821403 RepID=UPI001CE33CED|nr:hypothetical protein [Bradyrhizobium cenepequi]MCA6113004.1 hypothetical protein [Bradyrhizobium cenepequi]